MEYYQSIGKQTIICGDCVKEMDKLQPQSIDVVVTSPPYNLGIDYNEYKDNMPLFGYLDWMNQVFTSIKRILKDDGSFFLQVGSSCKEPWRAIDVGIVARQHFILQNDILWIKSVSVGDQSYGHFKPINSDRFVNQQHEHIFHFTKTGDLKVDKLAVGVPYQDKSNIERWKGKQIDLRDRGSVWYIPYKTVQKKKSHPAGFPSQLPEQCVKLHGLRPDLKVLDPFLGGGSTLQACKNLDVYGTGIEMDEQYCQLSEENLKSDLA